MAYYMVARRGRDPLMNGHLRNDTFSHGILRSAIRGLVTPRGVELGETCRLIFGPKAFTPVPRRIVLRAPQLTQQRWGSTRRFRLYWKFLLVGDENAAGS